MNTTNDNSAHATAEDLDERLGIAVANLEDLGDRLRLAVVAILSHTIRRQHLPPGLTFDSELWDRLRDLGGVEACAAVTDEIKRTESMLRRTCCGQEGNRE
ncbi:MAG: hypothetical protein WCC69_04810 [Pirellulales bacterium]